MASPRTQPCRWSHFCWILRRLQAGTDTLGHPWLTWEALLGPIVELRKAPLGLQCLFHFLYQNKTEHEAVVVNCSRFICSRTCPHVCDTHPPLAACKDRPFSLKAVQCGDKAKYYCTGNIEKSSLFGEVILPKHKNHRPMIDGVAPLSNSQLMQTIPRARSRAQSEHAQLPAGTRVNNLIWGHQKKFQVKPTARRFPAF